MLKIKDVAHVMQKCEERGEYTAADYIRKIIIHALSPNEKKVRQIIKENPWISTPDLAEKSGLPWSRAARIAKNLYGLGLVSRQKKYLGPFVMSRYWTWRLK